MRKLLTNNYKIPQPQGYCDEQGPRPHSLA